MIPVVELVPGFNVRGEPVRYLWLSNEISKPVIIEGVSPLSMHYLPTSIKRSESVSSTHSSDDFFLQNRRSSIASVNSTFTNVSEYEPVISK